MRVSVLVTTYGRRAYLQRCLESLLHSQERPPDEVVVVTRMGDSETETFVEGLLSSNDGEVVLCHARVEEPGVLAANRAGLPLVTGDIVCFIDDDAAARPSWLRRIEEHYLADATIGAVGGRDVQHTQEGIIEQPAARVGKILWYGRIVGDHDKAFHATCLVDHLKGVNMSFRREMLAPFDDRILGNAHYYEMDLCFAVRRSGYRILYDGDLIVDHYIDAPRYLPGNQVGRDAEREYFVHHNRVYVMMKNLKPFRRAIFLIYTFLRDAVVSAYKLVVRSNSLDFATVRAIFRGKLAGLRDFLNAPPARQSRIDHAARNGE